MADRLGTEMYAQPERVYIVLTGNLHNRLTIGSTYDADDEPMGYLIWLENPDIDVISLNMIHAGPYTGRCHIGPITAARPAHGP